MLIFMHQCLLSFCVHGALTKRDMMTGNTFDGRDVTGVPGKNEEKVMDPSQLMVSLFFHFGVLFLCTQSILVSSTTCVPRWAEPGPAPLNFVERFVRVSLTALVYICVGTIVLRFPHWLLC